MGKWLQKYSNIFDFTSLLIHSKNNIQRIEMSNQFALEKNDKWTLNAFKWSEWQPKKNKTIHFIHYMVNIRGQFAVQLRLIYRHRKIFLHLYLVCECVCVWLVSQPFLFNVCLNTSLHKLLVQYHIQVKRLRRMHKNSIYYAWSTGWN